MDADQLYNKLREVIEDLDIIVPTNADDHLVDACSAMIFGEEGEEEETPPQVNSYHFNMGNSTIGPLGMCARVQATSREQAVERLRTFLAACTTVSLKKIASSEVDEHIEYVNVYIEGDNVIAAHIEASEPVKNDG